MAFPYIYSVVAMWRLDRAGATLDRRALSIVTGTTACLYCVGVAVGQSHDLVFKAMIVLLATTPCACRLTGVPECNPVRSIRFIQSHWFNRARRGD